MKKSVIVLIILCIMLPLQVFAVSNVDFKINKYTVDANVKENGDVDVCEYMLLHGSYNGYVRDIFYKDGESDYVPSDLTNLKVYLLDTRSFSKSSEFTLVNSADKGDKLKYTVTNKSNGPTVTMFNENISGDSGFVVCYTLKDLVLVHNDVAELYYNFIPSGFEETIRDVTVNVKLPRIDDTLRVWAHGAIYGDVKKINNDNYSYLNATIGTIYPSEVLNVRMTFDKNIVNESTRITNKDALDEIISSETKLANEANELRKNAKKKDHIGHILFYLYIAFIVLYFIYIYKNYDKEYKTDFDMEYYRDFPNEYGPEIVEYLIKKRVTTDAYSASILNMIYKKCFTLEQTLDKKDYILTKKDEFTNPLAELEADIMEYLINEIGDGKRVKLSEIKKYGKKESTARDFLNHFNKWKSNVIRSAENYNFYEKKSKAMPIIILILTTLVFMFLSMMLDEYLYAFELILIFITLIYVVCAKRKSEFGILEYKKWMSFKKFLVDFGRFDEKELPEIILWEKYLVYATIFGVARQLEKTMKIKIEAMENVDTNMTDILWYNHMISNDFNRAMNETINHAYSVANSTIAASNMSSGSGSGGGFSGGGGGGGGHGF